MSEVADYLDAAAAIAAGVAVTPGPVGIVGGIAALALKAGSALSRAGKDPLIEIKRMLSAAPEVAEVHSDWDALIARTFVTDPPVAGDGSDIYDEEDDGEKEDQPP